MINFIGFTFVFALMAVLGLIVTGIWIWSIVDIISSNNKTIDKLLWLLLVFVFNILGSIVYFLAKDDVTIDKSKQRLKRSSEDRIIFGVCGGLADHFNTDPTIIRLLWVVLTIFSVGTGILMYIIAALIIPGDGKSKSSPGKVVAISLAAVFIILILCATLITLVAMTQYSEGNYESGVVHVEEGYDRAERITMDHIMSSTKFHDYKGDDVVCSTYKKIDGDICQGFKDPYGISVYSDDCYELKCKFDVDDPEIEGVIVQAVLVDDIIKEMSFEQVMKNSTGQTVQ